MRGFLTCVVCGIEHLDTEFALRTWTRYASRYSVPRSRTCRTCERRATMRRRIARKIEAARDGR